MFAKYFIHILFSVSINKAGGDIINNIFNVQFVKNNVPDVNPLIIDKNELEALIPDSKLNPENRVEHLEDKLNRILDILESYNINDIAEDVERKLVEWKKEMPDNLQDKMNLKVDALEQNLPVFTNTVTEQLEELEKNITKTLDNVINVKFKNASKTLEGDENCTSDISTMKIADLEKKISNKLEVIKNVIPDLEKNINCNLDMLEENLHKEIKPIQMMGCREILTDVPSNNSTFMLRIDATLNHVTVLKNYKGSVEYFEMHIALMAYSRIVLSSEQYFHTPESIYIDVGKDKVFLYLKHRKKEFEITGDSLIRNRFTAFSLIITTGTLRLFMEGRISPIMTYCDLSFNSVQYFGFYTLEFYSGSLKKFLYDCPAVAVVDLELVSCDP